MKKLLIVLTVFHLTISSGLCGLWSNLNDAIGAAVNDYNTDMLATGDSVITSMQTTASVGEKLNGAFTNYHTNIVITGDHALENSKAVYKALRDIAMWLPDQLKKLWEKFVAVLQSIRDKLNALNEQLGGKASRSFSNGLGDGFVERFAQAENLELKLSLYTQYWELVDDTGTKLLAQEKKHRDELLPKLTTVANECVAIEEILLDQLVASEKNLKVLVTALDKSAAPALQHLTDLAKKRLKASAIHSEQAQESRALLDTLPK